MNCTLRMLPAAVTWPKVGEFTTDAKGRARLRYRQLGNGKTTLPDLLDPVSLVRAVGIYNTSTQAVLTADLTSPDKLQYLIKRNLSTNAVACSLWIKSNLRQTQFKLLTAGLTPATDYWLVLNGGIVEQVGSPLDLYDNPANLFVAGFLGSPKMNFLPAESTKRQGGDVTLKVGEAGSVTIAAKSDVAIPNGQLTLGLRPEHLVVCKPEEGLRGKVDLIEELGDSTVIYAALAGSNQIVAAKLHGHAKNGMRSGDPLGVRPVPDTSNLFDASGKAVPVRVHVHQGGASERVHTAR